MPKIFIRKLFPVLALLLLIPWPVAYAHDFDTGATGGQDAVRIGIAEASVQPTWAAFGKTVGGVTPGALFYIDAINNSADIAVNIYITNAQELIGCYRYMILKVGAYVGGDSSGWERASMSSGEPFPDTFITMCNGRVHFVLPGLAKYQITIDGGSFYCTTTRTGNGSLAPQFYLTVD